jgi:hypothetical protein
LVESLGDHYLEKAKLLATSIDSSENFAGNVNWIIVNAYDREVIPLKPRAININLLEFFRRVVRSKMVQRLVEKIKHRYAPMVGINLDAHYNVLLVRLQIEIDAYLFMGLRKKRPSERVLSEDR